ncbi:MAG: hypothetical protein ACI4LD_02300 [Lentihominibacter sp.]
MKKSFLPAALMLTLAAAVILLILCLTASACLSVSQELEDAEDVMEYCDSYYAAETTAAEIISGYSGTSGNNSSFTSGQSGRITYSSPQGDILIFRADSSLSFSVPVNDQKELDVIVNASGSGISILKWSLENR